jgi:3-oxoadipate enol-lactonase
MEIIDRGSGPPLVVVPSLHGRWQYMAPAIDALSRFFRVLTFSLCDEPTSGGAFDPERGIDSYTDQVRAVLDAAHVPSAAVCGVSFGGVVALHFAAREPARCEKLILVSTPRPGFRLRRRHEIYARVPWLFGPIWMIEAPRRAAPEVRAALPDRRDRWRFNRWAVRTMVTTPFSLARMAARAQLLVRTDVRADCERIVAPTLVITGERGLDFVVPADGTADYARLIPGGKHVVLPRTGHQGPITRPEAFADLVREFVLGDATRFPHAAA